jgi:RNA polymerase sigma-70 factor (ECF subfamily)
MGAADERLVALARAGDEHAFAVIVERYRAPLLAYCRRLVPGATAEDALQQTFINAYAALSRADARAPVALRPWL